MLNIDYLFKDQAPAAIAPAQRTLIMNIEGCKVFARCMMPSLDREDEQRPAVLMMHGFPGNEQNRDVAQALRRIGFVAVIGGFRGCWGNEGYYNLTHLPDDCRANLAYLRANAKELHIDPERIYLAGHSMGGFTTMRLLSEKIDVKGAVLIAPCDITEIAKNKDTEFLPLIDNASPMLRLEKPGKELFPEEGEAHKAQWNFPELIKTMDPNVPKLFLGGKVDTTCPPKQHIMPALDTFEKLGQKPDVKIFDTDHCFQNVRIAYTRAIAEWLVKQEGK